MLLDLDVLVAGCEAFGLLAVEEVPDALTVEVAVVAYRRLVPKPAGDVVHLLFAQVLGALDLFSSAMMSFLPAKRPCLVACFACSLYGEGARPSQVIEIFRERLAGADKLNWWGRLGRDDD